MAAAGLFAVFAIVVAATLARGHRPDCGCFGRLHSRPLSGITLARAVALAAMAGIVAVGGTGGSAVEPLREPAAWLGAVAAAQSVLLVGVLRRHGRLLARLDGAEDAPAAAELAMGSAAPAFTLPDLSGELVTLDDLRAPGLPLLVVFADPGCGPCTALLPELARWQDQHRGRVAVALVSRGDLDVNRAHAEEHGLELVLLQEDREVAEVYGAHGTPSAVLIDHDGRIAGPVRYGADGVRELLTEAADRRGGDGSAVRRVRRAVVAASGASAAAAAGSAAATTVDEEDEAFREMKRIIKASNPKLLADARRLGAAANGLFHATDKRAARSSSWRRPRS